jgi:sigma-B regulation protein RsbU (phosphoserine phosphatase)
VAVTKVTLLEVSEEVFDRLIEESPAVAYALLTRVLDTARTIDQQALAELKSKNEALQKAYAELQAAQAELVIKERLEREMELAASVQRSLLPDELPQYPDYAFAAYLQPARQVGGDFYDVLHVDEEHVGLLMADVADKGMHAALFMAVTRTLFAQAGKLSLSPAHVAHQVHQGVMEIAATSDLFVTAFYGVLHRPSGLLTYVRAGHDRPLLYRPGQAVQKLTGDGRFLGMWPELNLLEFTIELKPGDRLLLLSDGVPDATNEHGEQYGNDRLIQALEASGHLPAADLVAYLAGEVDAWSQDSAPFDDLTLMVAEVKLEN